MEVEAKYRADIAKVREALASLGATLLESVEEVDAYFNHPCRDFASTDEALRVRRSRGGVEVSYKGPRMGGGAKTRLELTASAEGDVEAILSALGFKKVAEVRKRREYYSYKSFTISLDDVDGLGQFVEIELLVSSRDLVPEAERAIEGLAKELGLGERVDATYLELLLGRRLG